MSVFKLTKVEGNGNTLDRAVQITEAIKDACYKHGEGMAVAFIIGCLEIAKAEILEDQRE
jgi:hypothetical protein